MPPPLSCFEPDSVPLPSPLALQALLQAIAKGETLALAPAPAKVDAVSGAVKIPQVGGRVGVVWRVCVRVRVCGC